MSARELDAAGITDPALRASYERLPTAQRRHGRTYYLATLLLPAGKRPYVHALYGFARYADEIVDDLASTLTPRRRPTRCATGATGSSRREPARDATTRSPRPWCDTVRALGDPARALRGVPGLDADGPDRHRLRDLRRPATYVYGSAAVIGLQMVPILEPLGPAARRRAYALDLGVAFQLANFVRDVGEDLAGAASTCPLEDLRRSAWTRAHLERGVVDGPVRRLLAFEIARSPRAVPQRRAGHPAAAPDQPGLHPDRVRGSTAASSTRSSGRLPGARPSGSRCRGPAASAWRCPVWSGRSARPAVSGSGAGHA